MLAVRCSAPTFLPQLATQLAQGLQHCGHVSAGMSIAQVRRDRCAFGTPRLVEPTARQRGGARGVVRAWAYELGPTPTGADEGGEESRWRPLWVLARAGCCACPFKRLAKPEKLVSRKKEV